MKFVKIIMRVDIEIAMRVPDSTPLGDLPDLEKGRAGMIESMRADYEKEGATMSNVEVLSGPTVVEI